VILTGLALVGLPKIIPDQFSLPADTTIVRQPVQIGSTVADYPAATAGLQKGDTVIRLAGESIETSQELIAVAQANRGKEVPVVYERDGNERTATVALRDADSAVFGATLSSQSEKIKATWSAPLVGVATTVQLTWVTLQGLGQLIVDFFGGLILQLSTNEAIRQQASASLERASASVAGPIGILGIIFPAAGQSGIAEVLFLAAIISLTLAVMNVLPIPALDGGRWFVTALFKALKRPLTKEREERIQSIGFSVLMAIILLVTASDVAKLFS
jgi:regulator of sigma E protease